MVHGRALGWACAVGCVVVAYAGDGMTKTQEKALAKAQKTLERIERAVEGLEGSGTRGTPAFPQTVERKGKQQERLIGQVREAAAELPPEEGRELTARLADLERRLASLVAEGAGQTERQEGDAAAWEAHRQSDAYRADEATLQGLVAYDPPRFALKHRALRTPWDEEFRALLGLVAGLPAVRAQLAELDARYASFGFPGRHVQQKVSEGAARLAECEAAMTEAVAGGVAALNALGPELERETQAVFRLRDQAQAEGRPFPLGYTLMDAGSKCRELGRRIARTRDYLATLAPSQRAAFAAAAEQSLEPYRARVREATAEILASQELPPDDYAGPDRAELEAFAQQAAGGRVHGAKVLGVRLSGRWERTQGYRFDRTSKLLVQVDTSSLAGTLLVEHDAEFVLLRRIEVVRDHQRGDALQLFGDFVAYPEPLPDKLLPREKLE